MDDWSDDSWSSDDGSWSDWSSSSDDWSDDSWSDSSDSYDDGWSYSSDDYWGGYDDYSDDYSYSDTSSSDSSSDYTYDNGNWALPSDESQYEIDFMLNYSPGEDTNRPPDFMDWNDDGVVDDAFGGHLYDSSGNQMDSTSSDGIRVADWITNPSDWSYNGMYNGGWTYVGGSSDSSSSTYYYSSGDSDSSPSYTTYAPYIPLQPKAPAAPQAPASPGPEPQFTKESQKALVKYEYVYGIKDLQIRGNEYNTRSIYVSKPMQIDGNVMQVSLQATEEHPLFNSISGEATDRQTSVEYYVSYVDNPSLEDWHPILPEDQEGIKCELLIFDTARTATLRFPALTVEEATVYRNGIKYAKWAFIAGGTQLQLLEELTPGAIYTIDYTPNAEILNPWTLDIYQKGIQTARQIDLFPDGTNHNKTVVLSKYPYVDYGKINPVAIFDANTTGYRPVTVTLKDANIQAQNKTFLKEVLPMTATTTDIRTVNITDYKTKAWKQPQPYSLDKNALNLKFEYFHEGNKLYFSETFNKSDVLTNAELNHGDAKIQVEYDYLISNFRIKIILRHTGAAINSVTPVVHDYALKFKVMK